VDSARLDKRSDTANAIGYANLTEVRHPDASLVAFILIAWLSGNSTTIVYSAFAACNVNKGATVVQ
jgi:hypothetical protein